MNLLFKQMSGVEGHMYGMLRKMDLTENGLDRVVSAFDDKFAGKVLMTQDNSVKSHPIFVATNAATTHNLLYLHDLGASIPGLALTVSANVHVSGVDRRTRSEILSQVAAVVLEMVDAEQHEQVRAYFEEEGIIDSASLSVE